MGEGVWQGQEGLEWWQVARGMHREQEGPVQRCEQRVAVGTTRMVRGEVAAVRSEGRRWELRLVLRWVDGAGSGKGKEPQTVRVAAGSAAVGGRDHALQEVLVEWAGVGRLQVRVLEVQLRQLRTWGQSGRGRNSHAGGQLQEEAEAEAERNLHSMTEADRPMGTRSSSEGEDSRARGCACPLSTLDPCPTPRTRPLSCPVTSGRTRRTAASDSAPAHPSPRTLQVHGAGTASAQEEGSGQWGVDG